MVHSRGSFSLRLKYFTTDNLQMTKAEQDRTFVPIGGKFREDREYRVT